MVFLNTIKVSRSYTVVLAIEYPRDVHVVYKLFALLCFVFQGAAPMPYVQATNFNRPHLDLRSTTVLLDSMCKCDKYIVNSYNAKQFLEHMIIMNWSKEHGYAWRNTALTSTANNTKPTMCVNTYLQHSSKQRFR